MFYKRNFVENLLLVFIIFFISSLFVFNFLIKGEQQFSYLANSFLHNKLYFINQLGSVGDTVLYQGKYYWPLGVLPAIILLPFVFVSQHLQFFFYQGYLQAPLVLIIFYLIFRLAKHFGADQRDSIFWAFGFCFSTVFLGVAFLPYGWYFSQVITTLLELVLIWEFLNAKRYFYLGVILGLLFASRATTVLAVFLLLGDIFFSKIKFSKKIINLRNLFLALLPILFFVFLYNYLRFGSFFETGYTHQILDDFLVKTRDYGIFSFQHIPGNLYYFLVAGPLPIYKDSISLVLKFPYIKGNLVGMAFWVTSPILLLLFTNRIKDKFSKLFLFTSLVIAVPIFLYYGIGVIQFGYRYSLDFLPFLFVLLIRNYYKLHEKLSEQIKWMVLCSAFINFYTP
jgi:hypothetical protein